jgi:hypothetical protein
VTKDGRTGQTLGVPGFCSSLAPQRAHLLISPSLIYLLTVGLVSTDTAVPPSGCPAPTLETHSARLNSPSIEFAFLLSPPVPLLPVGEAAVVGAGVGGGDGGDGQGDGPSARAPAGGI